ncbi:MAG: protein kinase [Gemmatimonadetes bacterium]|nr:protein kinase [Gemmatimonadota bacterium]NIO30551.1 protein kinase [Gemmatimonadota bacterium]
MTGGPLAEGQVSLSSGMIPSFEEALHRLLRARLKLVLILGFIVALSVHFFYVSLTGLDPQVDTVFAPWIEVLYDLYLVAMGVALLLLFSRSWSMRTLRIIDYAVVTFCILLSHFIAIVYDLNEIPAFAISILLFVHAAFIPVPVGSQAALALTAALGFPLIGWLGYASIPELQAYWLANGGVAVFRAPLLEGTFQLGILAAISVVLTKGLYHLRLTLHRAQRYGNYVIESEIGHGGMGRVYVGQHALMCRPSAVKVMEAAAGEDDEAVARFEREVRLSATLTHPNTITIYDFGRTEQDTFYYAMEYLEGLSLEELVTRFGPVPSERTAFILSQVCGSLAEAHAKDIIHRDIKPSNIFLTHRGDLYDFVKVLDFGLAKRIRADESEAITAVGTMLGTPAYIAPEVVSEMGPVDQRADLYCLGGVAYWMLVGRPPFEATTSMEMILQHITSYPERPAVASEIAVPPQLDEVVMRCLEKAPGDRFQTAAELLAALRAIRFQQPWTHERASDWWRLHFASPIPANGSPQ